jgi:Nuclease-related domain
VILRVPPIFEQIFARLNTPQNQLIFWAVLLVFVAALGFFLLRAMRRRTARQRLHERITAVGTEYLSDVLVPDGMGASLHVDYLILTSRGVLVIDLRDIRGNIFGGDQMTQWTVMSGASRATFQNPQHALYDRVAAVRALSGDLSVEGRVLFTRRGKFPKGLPRWTLMVDSLATEFPVVESDAMQAWISQYRDAWQKLCAALSPSNLREPPAMLTEIFDTKA